MGDRRCALALPPFVVLAVLLSCACGEDEPDGAVAIRVTPTGGLVTSERGVQATFTLDINIGDGPKSDVVIDLSSSDLSEGRVEPSVIVFTPDDWDSPRTVTVTGEDDSELDNHQMYTVITSAARSADARFDGLDPADVTLKNFDDDVAGFVVTPTTGLTTEGATTATFTLALSSEPMAEVKVDVASSDVTEGTIDLTELTFTSENWATPQTVTVTGVDDALVDGMQTYNVVPAAAVSADAAYDGRKPGEVTITNLDNDTASIVVTPASGLIIAESGSSATFDVIMTAQPTADVTVSLTNTDTTEATLSTTVLTFTPSNWAQAQTVTVTAKDDALEDGNATFSILTAPAVSTDILYSGMNAADVSITNLDDDASGISVIPSSALVTSETGAADTFIVVLNSQPTDAVTVDLVSDTPSEGIASPAQLTFTPANWSQPQTVTVSGVDDAVADGNIGFSIVTAPATSNDTNYNGLNPLNVGVLNQDNDVAGITVLPRTDMSVRESGTTEVFNVRLNTQPTANVTIDVASQDASEAMVDKATLTFTPSDWSTPQYVTVTGVDDALVDGNQTVMIQLGPSTSADANYMGLRPADVVVVNLDDDDAGITVSADAPLIVCEGEISDENPLFAPMPLCMKGQPAYSEAYFSVVLNSAPTDSVSIRFVTSDPTEGALDRNDIVFTPADWSTPQYVQLLPVDDEIMDGDISYQIRGNPAGSNDPSYAGIAPPPIECITQDDDTDDTMMPP